MRGEKISRKTSTIQLIILLGVVSSFLFAPSTNAQAGYAGREKQRSMMLASAVEFRWDKDLNARQAHESLGTKVSENTVLTHNHFQNLAGTHIIDPSNIKRPHGVSKTTQTAPFGSSQYGAQTRLVYSAVKYAGAVAPIASQRTIQGLDVGDMVDVVYWDDPREQLATATFLIKAIRDNTVMVLDDPGNIINSGDSGGGVFYNGQLVGNTWRYVQSVDRAGNQVDKEVHVQIEPPEMSQVLGTW